MIDSLIWAGESTIWSIPSIDRSLATPDLSYVAYLKQLASEDKINLIFAGNVPDGDLYTLMAGSDAFLFSSKFESFGVAMVEAVYSGARVISADTGVARDLSFPVITYGFAHIFIKCSIFRYGLNIVM